MEDFNSLSNVDGIVEPYINMVKPKHLRVFLARSDPALNYGLICAVLLQKIALSKLKKTATGKPKTQEHVGIENK